MSHREPTAPSTDQGDLLSLLVLGRDQDTGAAMTDQQIHDEVITLALSASATTAQSLRWAFHQLGQHPDIADRIVAEVREVVGDRPPDYDELTRLDYTGRVVSELLRLYPSWVLMRRTLGPTTLGRYELPAGAQVLISPIAMHRDPSIYPDPLRLDPDPVAARTRRPDPAARVHPVRRGQPPVHRQPLRLDRARGRARHPAAPLGAAADPRPPGPGEGRGGHPAQLAADAGRPADARPPPASPCGVAMRATTSVHLDPLLPFALATGTSVDRARRLDRPPGGPGPQRELDRRPGRARGGRGPSARGGQGG